MATSCAKPPMLYMEISKNWRFRKAGSEEWLPASVPGCVHADLLDRGRIEDPFYGDNEKRVQWIEYEDWEYRATFDVSREFMKKKNAEILFEGLDTYADVYLNDELVLSSNNMFCKWDIECSDILKHGKNTLEVYFHSPVKRVEAAWDSMEYRLPGGPRVLTRKAAYQYGWDWGPRFPTVGIWRPAYLRAWDQAKINNLQIVQHSGSDEKAELSAIFEIESSIDDRVTLSLFDMDGNRLLGRTEAALRLGENSVTVDFVIKNPLLWWTNGLGEAHLYNLLGELRVENNVVSRISERIGVRTLELVTDKDSAGEQFYFELNGIPLFIKGANYVPQDNFLPRVTSAHYEKLIRNAVDANMNMLRVWGGGIYENDILYDLCDENGILVWQDFMFANAMYPDDSLFLENVEREAAQNVIRLRNHPSLALWCGNNEIDEAWHNWGWPDQFGYSAEDSSRIWNNYKQLFHTLLPGIVGEYDNRRPYWPSSPQYGRGDERSLYEGDSHYWGVWHDAEPYEIFKEKIGRFMSEYGFQSFPRFETLESFSRPENWEMDSEVMLSHQKHPRGNQLIRMYMERDYNITDDFDEFVYLSQVLQAEVVKTGIEAHRRARPYCMGTLYWQLNDCWPAISWSSVGYSGRWKALHYYVKKAYNDILVSPTVDNGVLRIFVISDRLIPVNGILKLELLDFSGEKLWQRSIESIIQPNTSKLWFEEKVETLVEDEEKRSAVLVAEVGTEEGQMSRNLQYFVPPKDLNLPKATIARKIKRYKDGYVITLTSDKLAKNLFLRLDDPEGHFSDNYFDLLPGETVEVLFKVKKRIRNLDEKLRITSLADTFDGSVTTLSRSAY
ncbi:MAG: glycoside hydrolase family 2 protein [Candidatus Latescibacteria bacterium]|nr:glycoside hydrolase family 2 protein [Candidatus Latescibacterota bacterium]NIO57245.1 glycoside hydrolase family 2 protein [Candidatus Latescibacterota bacterium]